MSANACSVIAVACIAISILFQPAGTRADDWPMYRYDSSRGASASQQLADELHLQWMRELPEPRRAWPWQQDDFEKLAFDASYQPVVAGELMYVASMVSDSVTAYAIDTGEQRWRYMTDGPVRMAPLVWQGRVYAASDDGVLHCINAETGEPIWKFQAAPNHRKVLGNERLISMWPLRGGPVIADGTLYFAAGIWPHEGVFIYAIDAETAEVQWVNSGSASDLMLDSKRYYSFGGVAPQGQLVIAGDRLLVPGGRTAPAAFDRKTGQKLFFNIASHTTGKAAGGHNVFTHGDWFFNDRDRLVTDMYSVVDGAHYGSVYVDIASDAGFFGVRPQQDRLYGYASQVKRTSEQAEEPEVVFDRRGQPITESRRDAADRAPGVTGRLRMGALSDHYDLQRLWTSEIEGIQQLHLMAGSTIYGSGKDGKILALDIADIAEEPVLKWTKNVDGDVFSMIAARDRLFVVTEEGRIYCFGPEERDAVTHEYTPESLDSAGDEWADRAEQLLAEVDARGGYGLMFGIGSGRLLEELLAQSDLHIVAFDPDADKVAALRERFTEAGLYGRRVAVHQGDATSLRLPPYIASLIVCEDPEAAGYNLGAAFAQALFHPLRPYGGIAYLALDEAQHEAFAATVEQAELENGRLARGDGHVMLSRPGALPGSDTWTHQYSDAANSGYSADKRVKAPLGIAWFGGEPNHKTLPRHLHGPIPQAVEGRLILLGAHHVSARCVYTGVELWAVELPEVGANFTSWEHEEEMARGDRTVYFPNHPGANFIGAPLASAADSIYIIYDDRCLRLDAATGEQLAAFEMPDWEKLQQQVRDPFTERMLKSYGAQLQEGKQMAWGNIRYEGDFLIAAAYPHMFDDQQPGREGNWNATSSEFIVVMDRYDGQIQWVQQARYGFRHNAIAAGGDKVFVIDNLSEEIRQRMGRRGIEPEIEPLIAALDLATGDVLWIFDDEVFGTSLSYSQEHDVLVQSGHPGRRQPLSDEPQDRLLVLRGEDGEMLWAESFRQRRSPLGLHASRRQILGSTGEGAADMLTGERPTRRHPMTGQTEDWLWIGALRCGTQNFSEHLALFRSGAAGFADLAGGATTGNIPGFRPGCTNNLIVADGMLNAPEYSRSCSCSYQMQTSLGLVHMPEAEMWTYNPLPDPEPGTIRRAGINFGAPASRLVDPNEMLWLEYPPLVGPTPEIPVQVETADDATWFHHHSSIIEQENDGHRWVVASGVQGVRNVRLDGLATEGGNPGPLTYQIRLHFAEPAALEPGERLFHISVQGERVLSDFDVADRAGGRNIVVVAEMEAQPDSDGAIEIALEPANDRNETLLCGVEIRAIE